MKNFDLRTYLSNNPLLAKKEVIKEGIFGNMFSKNKPEEKPNGNIKLSGKPHSDGDPSHLYYDHLIDTNVIEPEDENWEKMHDAMYLDKRKLEKQGIKTQEDEDEDNLYFPKLIISDESSEIDESKKKMTKESLRTKIREMVLAEVKDEDGVDINIGDTVTIPRDLTTDPYNKRGESGKIINIDDEDVVHIEFEDGKVGKYDRLVFRSLDEAKKKDDEPKEDGIEDIDLNIDNEEIPSNSDMNVSTDEIDPTIKAVQDALTQAQSAAEKLNDPKLSKQIGNTITQFTRTHISNQGTEADPVFENAEDQFSSEEDLSKHANQIQTSIYEIDVMARQILGLENDDDLPDNLDEKYNINESIKKILKNKKK